jgi:signal transduction histidine kinase
MKNCRFRFSLLMGIFTSVMLLPCAYAEISYKDLETKSEQELSALLASVSRSDRGRVHTFLGRITIDRDPQLARKHLQSADAVISQQDLAGRSYLDASWCWVYITLADLAKAQQKCGSAVMLAETSQDHWAMTKAYGALAALNYQTGELRQAYEMARKAVDASMQVGSAQLTATQYNSMGLIARAQGLFRTGLDYFVRGLEIVDPQVHEEIFHILSFNVGLSYSDLGEYEIAKDFYSGEYEWAVETKRYSKELTVLIYTAIADVELGHAEEVVRELGSALERPELRENNGYLAFAYAVLGEAHLALANYPAALEVFEIGMRIAEANPNTFEQRQVKTGYARALFETGDIDRARSLVTEAIQQLRAENARLMLLPPLNLLGELEEAEGNFAASLGAYKESARLTRDFQQQAIEHQLATLRTEFELDEKEQELAAARQDTIIRNGVIVFVLGLAIMGYLGVSRRMQKQRAERETEHADRLETVVAERTGELEEKIEQANLLESARIALERQLAEAEKLRVLGQLTGGVAHDFNNLLTVVIGSAELLKDMLPQDSEQDVLLDHITTAAASGAGITRALMAYARKQPLQLETVVLNDILRVRLPIVGRTLGGMVSIRLDLEQCAELKVVLDTSQLTSALLNLALNARDAQNNHGEIVVGLEQRDKKWAVISVTDTGKGMTPDELSRAVEPFYTTKEETQGNGLGLSMVYGFSKQIGGDLEIESQIGVGTQVRVVLPLAHLADTRVREIKFGQGNT